LKRTW